MKQIFFVNKLFLLYGNYKPIQKKLSLSALKILSIENLVIRNLNLIWKYIISIFHLFDLSHIFLLSFYQSLSLSRTSEIRITLLSTQ